MLVNHHSMSLSIAAFGLICMHISIVKTVEYVQDRTASSILWQGKAKSIRFWR